MLVRRQAATQKQSEEALCVAQIFALMNNRPSGLPNFVMDRLSSDLKLAAQRELGETPQVRRDAVEQLRKLLAEEPELQCPLDEEFLVKFLRGRKYRVEEAFENIRKYFRARLEHPDIFVNLLPSRIMFDAIFHQNKLLTILKEPDSLGRRILLVKFGAWNPTVCSLNEYIRANLVVSECGLLNQMAQIAGVVGVADLDGLTMSHLLYYTPSEIKTIIKLIQECYPLRIKGVYVVNNPALFELLFAVAKLFLKPKLLKRFRFIGRDYEKLHELIPRDRLPEEYGGTLDPFDYDDYERNLRSQENYFVELGRYGYRERHSQNE
ncbi:unnamed protein product, partial [Ixodes persulcatus]